VTYLDGNPETNWTAAGYPTNAIPEGNPLTGLWSGMGGSPVVDHLVMWGLTLAGLASILGAFVRWSAFWGAAMMLLFWAAALEGGLMPGSRSNTGSSSTPTSSMRPCCSGSAPSARAGSSASTPTSRG